MKISFNYDTNKFKALELYAEPKGINVDTELVQAIENTGQSTNGGIQNEEESNDRSGSAGCYRSCRNRMYVSCQCQGLWIWQIPLNKMYNPLP